MSKIKTTVMTLHVIKLAVNYIRVNVMDIDLHFSHVADQCSTQTRPQGVCKVGTLICL